MDEQKIIIPNGKMTFMFLVEYIAYFCMECGKTGLNTFQVHSHFGDYLCDTCVCLYWENAEAAIKNNKRSYEEWRNSEALNPEGFLRESQTAMPVEV